MRKRTSMLYCLLLVASNGVGLVASEGPRQPVAPAAKLARVALPIDGHADVACRFTHRGDQSRSLELAVTGLRTEGDENAAWVLAWTEPSFTLHLDGYEYRGFVAGEGSRGAVWIDAGGPEPAVMLPASLSRRGYDFEVVARYRYPLRDGHAYYWYGPVASSEQTVSPNAGCGPTFGPPDTTLAFE